MRCLTDPLRAVFAVALLATAASCGSSLSAGPPAPGPILPELTDEDCVMFDPTVCRLDVDKTSVGIDVHYPNAFYCQLQILPTRTPVNRQVFGQLASSWQFMFGWAGVPQTIVPPEMPRDGVL